MALSDLYTELQKDSFKVDSDSEKKIVNKLLSMVADDTSGDVKGFAVKWYRLLAFILSVFVCVMFFRGKPTEP